MQFLGLSINCNIYIHDMFTYYEYKTWNYVFKYEFLNDIRH
jgi:hypothetical protein